MEYKTENRRKYLLGLIVLLAVATATTYAWTASEISTDTEEVVYSVVQTTTGHTITSFTARPYGKNHVKITFNLVHADDESADLTFQLLDTSGNVVDVDGDFGTSLPVAANSLLVDGVASSAGSTASAAGVAKTFYFKKTGIVSDFKGILIQILPAA